MADDDRDQIDFRALDPTRDPKGFERRVSAILARAETRLADRRRIDLTSLDPTRHPDRFDRLVSGITDRAALLLARRRRHTGALSQLARWQRPVAAAAAIVLIVSYAVLSRFGQPALETTREPGLSESIGVPAQVVQWMGAEQQPSAAEFLFTVAGN